MAASKPIATAVVGPGGLAIARPIATAIAGVAPEDAIIPLTGEGYLKLPQKKKEKCQQKNCEEEKPDKEKKKVEKPHKDEDEDYIERFRFKSFYHWRRRVEWSQLPSSILASILIFIQIKEAVY